MLLQWLVCIQLRCAPGAVGLKPCCCTHSCPPQVPMVIRGPGGVGRQLGAEHSQRLESYFQSIPGADS